MAAGRFLAMTAWLAAAATSMAPSMRAPRVAASALETVAAPTQAFVRHGRSLMSDRGEPTSTRLRRAIDGDRESFGWVVAHFDPLVIAQVRLRLGAAAPTDDAIRDVVDEVWLVTLR